MATIDKLKDKWWKKGMEVGKLAAQGKAWMSISDVVVEFTDADFKGNDDDDLCLMNRAAWGETDHFGHWYGLPMLEDAGECLDQEATNESVTELWLDLVENFWDGYENESGIYDALRAERVKRNIGTE